MRPTRIELPPEPSEQEIFVNEMDSNGNPVRPAVMTLFNNSTNEEDSNSNSSKPKKEKTPVVVGKERPIPTANRFLVLRQFIDAAEESFEKKLYLSQDGEDDSQSCYESDDDVPTTKKGKGKHEALDL